MTPSERRQEILTEWRTNQGFRGAAGIPAIMRCLEFIASQRLANVKDGERLRLSAKDLRLAQHHAISQERKRLHGEPPRDADAWWEQISAIAVGWGIATAREDWTRDKPAEPEQPARYSATEAA